VNGWRRLKWTYGIPVVCMAIVLVPAIGIWGTDASTRGPVEATGPLISRGYTDVRAGSALVAGDPQGGELVAALNVRAGDFVRKGQVLALLSNAPAAELDVAMARANIERARSQEQSMLSGFRRTEVELQEAAVRLAATKQRLNELELSRTTLPPDERELRMKLLRLRVEQEEAKLKVRSQRLDSDRAAMQAELAILEGQLAQAEYAREQATVRAPLDGVVTDVLTYAGERVSPRGVVRIIDLKRMRIFADVDELHLRKLKKDGRVEFTIRGDANVHVGRIVRLPSTVKRTKMSEADFGESTARLAEIEVEPLDHTTMTRLIGQETRLTFR
jgi:HlyD family secretion protein